MTIVRSPPNAAAPRIAVVIAAIAMPLSPRGSQRNLAGHVD